MGFRTLKEMVGRSDMLRVDEASLHAKTRTLDLGPILTPAAALAPGEGQINSMTQDHFSPDATGLDYYGPDVTPSGYNLLDDVLIERASDALEHGTPVVIDGLEIA